MQTRNLIGALALGVALTATSIIPSYAQTATPNLYTLNGRDSRGYRVNVTYSTTSFIGQPQLNYQDQQQTLNFSGNDIRTAESEIGTLVTVTIRRTVDTGSTTFSLLIPRVNLGSNQSVPIDTNGITTVNRFSVIPQFNQGQIQTYTVTPLKGTAQIVAF